MILSFAYTTQALIEGRKTVTRRDWKPKHAETFLRRHVVGDQLVKAYDRLPIQGGRHIADLEITRASYEPLQRLLDCPEYAARELLREGALWNSIEDFIGLLSPDFDPGKRLWRIEFHVVSLIS